jgi:hypothetical protein
MSAPCANLIEPCVAEIAKPDARETGRPKVRFFLPCLAGVLFEGLLIQHPVENAKYTTRVSPRPELRAKDEPVIVPRVACCRLLEALPVMVNLQCVDDFRRHKKRAVCRFRFRRLHD